MPETVLVVGANGLLGSSAVRALGARGHTVHALVRRAEDAERVRAEHVVPTVGDLSGRGDWSALWDGVTAVVDATQVRVRGRLTVRTARRIAAERGRMTGFLLDQVRRRSPPLRVFVALSGLEDYGPTGDAWFDESFPKASEPRGYSHLSVQSRAQLSAARSEWGLPLVLVRLGLVYGASGWFPEFARRVRGGRGTLVGPGTNFSSLVSAADGGAGIRAAVERASPGEEFLVVDDEPMRQVEWQAALARALGAPPVTRSVPVWLAGWAVGRVNAETFSASRRARNQRAKERLGLRLAYPTVRAGFPAVLGPGALAPG
jgi:nucleoside-diphosphate-sugar epimerase